MEASESKSGLVLVLRRRPRPRGLRVMRIRKRGQVCGLVFALRFDFVEDLSRRDNRTQPGVLTPGADKKMSRPEGGGRTVASDYGDVFKQTVDQNIFRPFRAGSPFYRYQGLKPLADSFHPFGMGCARRECLPGVHENFG